MIDKTRYVATCSAYTPFGSLITRVSRPIATGLYDAERYPASILVRKLRRILDVHLLTFYVLVYDKETKSYTHNYCCKYGHLFKLLKNYE